MTAQIQRMTDDACETLDKAIAAYFRAAHKAGIYSPDQPSNLSDLEGDWWVLENVRGELARVHYFTGEVVL